MPSWKILFLLIVAVGTVVCQNDAPDADADDDDDDDAAAAPQPEPERPCSGCKDGSDCYYEGDWFIKNKEEYECKGGQIQKKVDPTAGMCLAHTEIGRDKWMKPDEEYVLRCNTWKCNGEFQVMMFVKADCRDDFDKCFGNGETLVKNGHEVICRIFGSGHIYEFPPPATEAPAAEGGK